MRGRQRWGAVAWMVLLGTLAACGSDPCGGRDSSDSSHSPEIKHLDLFDQMEGDPWTLIFAAEFADKDGDLGNTGSIDFYLNDSSSPSSIDLASLFGQSELAAGAKSGEIAIPLRFNETNKRSVRLNLGAQMVDAAQHISNCYTLDLQFNIRAVEP